MPSAACRNRVWQLGSLGCFSLLLLGCWHLGLRRPVGDGPAGPAVDRARFARAWTDRKVLLVGLGDSVTAGFGAAPGHSYFQRLITNVASDAAELHGLCLSAVLPGLASTNLAMSGSTSLQALRAQLPKLGRHAPEIFGLVVITIGGNDLIHNYGLSAPVDGAMYGATREQARPWVEAFRLRLETLLDGVQAAFPGGSRIYLANLYDPSDGTGSLRLVGLPTWPDGLRLHTEFNDILAMAAHRTGVRLVDIHSEFLGHGISCAWFWRPGYRRDDPHWWYHANVEDPNERGYDALRRLFLNAIASDLAVPGFWQRAAVPR